jgi:hypothetical protein
MRKTLLLFTTTAVALLLAAGTAWAALPAPTVEEYRVGTATVPPTPPPLTGVATDANITATFSEAMSSKSFQISNHSTSTSLSKTFYLLPGGHFTAPSATKNPPYHCTTIGTRCPAAIPATVSYIAGNKTAFTLNPTSLLQPGTKYTVVVEGTADGDYVAVKDADGTPMLIAGTGDYIFHFTTA